VRKAVIDVGSGSVLLLVAEQSALGWTPIHETSRMTFLGEAAKQTGRLLPARMEATLAAIAEAWVTAKALNCDVIDAVGTMALRITDNAAEFLDLAAAQGTPVTVISGELEAELGFRAVIEDPRFSDFDRLSILDPGGQSTELTMAVRTGDDWKKTFQHSFPLGTLQLRGGILSVESPGPGEILATSAQIDDTIGVEIAPADPGPVVALGAPGTDLVMIRNGWTTWDASQVHGSYLEYEEVGKAVGWLMRMTDAQREAIPGIEPGRGHTIHAGCLILERFLNGLAAPGVWVSVRGWRHAWLSQER
jgi:exopolyphosphatase/guanosine-5'-triphosphate,3'-diphosphate pyrophosphatase